MKKTLQKITVLFSLILSSHFCYGEQTSLQDFSLREILSLKEKTIKSDKLHKIDQMFAMKNLLGLQVYHYGIRRLHPQYLIPTEKDLLKQIRTHRFFTSKVTPDELRLNKAPFVIFEQEKEHFYLAYQGKTRHFTVNNYAQKGSSLAGIENGESLLRYPSVEALIRCTFS